MLSIAIYKCATACQCSFSRAANPLRLALKIKVKYIVEIKRFLTPIAVHSLFEYLSSTLVCLLSVCITICPWAFNRWQIMRSVMHKFERKIKGFAQNCSSRLYYTSQFLNQMLYRVSIMSRKRVTNSKRKWMLSHLQLKSVSLFLK